MSLSRKDERAFGARRSGEAVRCGEPGRRIDASLREIGELASRGLRAACPRSPLRYGDGERCGALLLMAWRRSRSSTIRRLSRLSALLLLRRRPGEAVGIPGSSSSAMLWPSWLGLGPTALGISARAQD